MTREEIFVDLVAKQHLEMAEYKQTVATAISKIHAALKDEPENQTINGDVGDLVVAVVNRLRNSLIAADKEKGDDA